VFLFSLFRFFIYFNFCILWYVCQKLWKIWGDSWAQILFISSIFSYLVLRWFVVFTWYPLRSTFIFSPLFSRDEGMYWTQMDVSSLSWAILLPFGYEMKMARIYEYTSRNSCHPFEYFLSLEYELKLFANSLLFQTQPGIILAGTIRLQLNSQEVNGNRGEWISPEPPRALFITI